MKRIMIIFKKLFKILFGKKEEVYQFKAPKYKPVDSILIRTKKPMPYIDRMSIKDVKDKKARRKANKVSRKSRAINHN